MRKENVKVLMWGIGEMGKGMVEMLLDKGIGPASRKGSKGEGNRFITQRSNDVDG